MGKVLDLFFNLDVAISGGGVKNIQLIGSQLSKLQAAGERLSSKSSMIAGFQAQSEKARAAAESLEVLRGSYRYSDAALQASRARTASLSEQYQQARERVKSWSATMPKNSVFLQTAVQREKELARAYRESQRETAKLERQRDKLYRRTGTAEAQLNSEQQALEQLGQSLRDAGLNTDRLSDEQQRLAQNMARVQKAQERWTNIRSQLSWDNIKADFLKSTALLKTFEAPVKVNMDFEQAMADVAAVARPTAEEFARLTEQAKLLGRTTQYTASDAAKAQQNLIRAGMTADQVIKAMPATLNMASAEGISIDQSSNIIAKALGGMNLAAELAPRLVDILSYTSAHTNTDTLALSEAFKVAAPVAASQNIRPEQLASYLGIMANKGYEGSEAGNALGSSIQRLAKLPAEARNALSALGVAVRTREGQMVELPEIMRQLNTKLSRFGENEQLGYLTRIFGANYGKQMLSFMQATAAGDTEKLQAGVYNESFGWSAQSTKIRTNTLKGDIDALSSAWEGLMNRVGEGLMPVVRPAVQFLTTCVNKITDIMNMLGPITDYALRIGAAFAAWRVVAVAGKYTSLLLKLPAAYLETISAAKAAGAAVEGFGLLTKANTAIQWLWNAALNANPIGLLITGIAAAVVAIAALYHNWDAIVAKVQEVCAYCQAKWEAFKGWLSSIDWSGIWEGLKQAALDVVDWLKAPFVAFGQWLTEMFSKLNPFKNWNAPSVDLAAGKAAVRSGTVQNLAPSYMQAHATGGILTTPHIGLVAEAGPEAVIPLRDKARGVPLLMQAAELLGVTPAAGGYLSPSASSPAPAPVNITVNVQGNGEDAGLAERIAQAVRDALSDIMSLEERVSYA